ncbi:hypothetical protein [Solitalea lacus]|uniref:hypothetical protein n=1 Tax=Solitalea lacus TaxID=2911172 RepID=UPI001EDC7595|nr:hypothetical protein [Solitalea lacus]UKJ06120.1 hypothetical protein L2B55_11235 [Solitalea lacus]
MKRSILLVPLCVAFVVGSCEKQEEELNLNEEITSLNTEANCKDCKYLKPIQIDFLETSYLPEPPTPPYSGFFKLSYLGNRLTDIVYNNGESIHIDYFQHSEKINHVYNPGSDFFNATIYYDKSHSKRKRPTKIYYTDSYDSKEVITFTYNNLDQLIHIKIKDLNPDKFYFGNTSGEFKVTYSGNSALVEYLPDLSAGGPRFLAGGVNYTFTFFENTKADDYLKYRGRSDGYFGAIYVASIISDKIPSKISGLTIFDGDLREDQYTIDNCKFLTSWKSAVIIQGTPISIVNYNVNVNNRGN